jgi:hypothetical protein
MTDEFVVELSKLEREALWRARERQAASQLGELFTERAASRAPTQAGGLPARVGADCPSIIPLARN